MNTPVSSRLSDAVGLRRAVLPGVLWPGRPASSALVEAERGLATLFLMLRVGIVIQIVVGSIAGISESPHPAWYAALGVVIVLHIAVTVWMTWRAETVLPCGWGWIDLGISVLAMIACGMLLPPHDVVGTWESWASGYVTGTAAAVGVWCRRGLTALLVTSFLGVVYAATARVYSNADAATILGNSVTYPIFGISAILFSAYWRRLATGADTATEFAIKTAKQAQMDRYKLTVHDPASILRLLGDETTPPDRLAALRRQAIEESHRLRAYLSETPHLTNAPASGTVLLGKVITDAASGFTDLPLELLIDLAATTPLPVSSAAPLSAAVTTLLHNVRMHAGATEVTMHADVSTHAWEIVLADNGRGFDPSTVAYGFGLRHQATEALAGHQITTHVRSTPGHGTTITITGATGYLPSPPPKETPP